MEDQDGAPSSKRVKLNPMNNTTSKEKTLSVVDALALEHSVSNLQNAIKQIVEICPTHKELERYIKDGSLSNETLLILKRSNMVLLGSQLKSLYKKEKLKLFDQIINFNAHPTQLSKKNTRMSSKAKGMEDDDSASQLEIATDPLDVDPNNNSLPKLPEIKDKVIEETVFTHKSIVNKLSHLDKAALLSSHNERFEFLGDSVLNNAITLILYDRFKQETEGELTLLRAKLVSNSTLSEWSKMYGFPQRLKSEIDHENEEAFLKGRTKVYADVFEAYVGGLMSDNPNNMSVIKDWLEKLSRPLIDELVLKKTKTVASDSSVKNAKAELYALIGCASFNPEYQVTQVGDGFVKLFEVQCVMGSDVIGVGTGRSIKEAGAVAALNALNDRNVISKYAALRMNTPRSITSVKQTEDNKSVSSNGESGSTGSISNGLVIGDETQSTLAMSTDSSGSISSGSYAADDKLSEEHPSLPINVSSPSGEIDMDSKRKLNELVPPKTFEYKFTELLGGWYEATICHKNKPIVKVSGVGKQQPSQIAAMFILNNPHLIKKELLKKE